MTATWANVGKIHRTATDEIILSHAQCGRQNTWVDVIHRTHNPKVVGSSQTPATKIATG